MQTATDVGGSALSGEVSRRICTGGLKTSGVWIYQSSAASPRTLTVMTEPRSKPTVEQELRNLRDTLERYTKGHTNPTPKVAADLTKGIHELGDHMIALNRRLQKLEETCRSGPPMDGILRRGPTKEVSSTRKTEFFANRTARG